MKKYRLKIPEMIRREDAHLVSMIGNGAILVHDREANKNGYTCVILNNPSEIYPPKDGVQFCYPDDWLEEIKDDDDRWLEQEYGIGFETREYSAADMRWAFNAGKHYDKENPGIKNNAKDEPLSAKEYMDWIIKEDTRGGDCHRCWVQGNRYGFEAGEENQKLRHRPQQTFTEWWKEMKFEEDDRFPDYPEVWNACLKSRNLLKE